MSGLNVKLSILLLATCTVVEAENLTIKVYEEETQNLLPCRIHLKDPSSKPVKPEGLPFFRDHFDCPGSVSLSVPPGSYTYTVERGPEYQSLSGTLSVERGRSTECELRLKRLVDLKREGWWSGEFHIHRAPEEIRLLMQAEDLHIAPVITWWNGKGVWAHRPLPENPLIEFDTDRFYHLLAGEDERGGGALLYFNLPEPLPLEGNEREYPPSTRFLREAKRHSGAGGPVWVDIEKPFWWDVPIWLSTQSVDSVGICHNHMQKAGVLDNEAWGRARDRKRYPPPAGNGLWTQYIYYQILNAGFRLPPSAGSASGVLPNPVGYNRMYVHVEGPLSYSAWWRNLKKGRVFVTNGPLLRVRANGKLPGYEFHSAGPLQVTFDVRLTSRDPVSAVELVLNGKAQKLPFPPVVTIEESGWFLIRAIAKVENNFRFASTGPWYVVVNGKKQPVREDAARFFLKWTRIRRKRIEAALHDPAKKKEALKPVQEAEKFWKAKLREARKLTLVTGEIRDAESGRLIPARLYIQRSDGRFFFATSASPQGTAVSYRRRNWINPNAIEYHTTLSAHPFQAELEPGVYTFTACRGTEWRPASLTVTVGDKPVTVRLELRRWVNMARLGWFSGDLHVHRSPAELPNVMLAEDLNVAFPLVNWATRAGLPASQGDKNTPKLPGPQLVQIDKTHVFWQENSEYEIFSVKGRRHTLGAVILIGHEKPLRKGVPPVGPVAREVHRQGGLIDLEKHDWPWSMALVPVAGVDLYELANNHMWRTEFSMTRFTTPPPDFMRIVLKDGRGDEKAWTLYTFANYYALLDCGFRIMPSAGTASGVHPVPLGFGRVYVHLPEGFSYKAWLKELKEGRTFVTTGPMLIAEIRSGGLRGRVLSLGQVRQVEVIVNGRVAQTLPVVQKRNKAGAWEGVFEAPLTLETSGWVALRCFEERAGGRFRFAHTAPRWFEIAGRPLRPKRVEVEFLCDRVRREIERSKELLPPEAIAEYRKALSVYEKLLQEAVSE